MRGKGAVMIGEAITSLQAPGFLHSRDKLSLFTARIFVSQWQTLAVICLLFLCISSIMPSVGSGAL